MKLVPKKCAAILFVLVIVPMVAAQSAREIELSGQIKKSSEGLGKSDE